MRTDGAFGAIGNTYATDIAITERPAGPALGQQATILGLGIERDDARTAQIGQVARRLPFSRHCRGFREIASRCRPALQGTTSSCDLASEPNLVAGDLLCARWLHLLSPAG